MRWLVDIWFRLRAILTRGEMEADLEDEFAFHLEMEARKLEASGMSAREARRLAKLRFGGEDRFKESTRDAWGVTAWTDLLGDVRFAARQLRKHAGWSAIAVTTLALGIGGTVALFSVIDSLMLRPLPIADEDEVVVFWSDYNWRGEEFDHVVPYATAFSSLAAFSNQGYTLHTESGSSLVVATLSTVALFDVLGVAPLLGRALEPGEDRPGAEPVAVLAHGFWVREFGSDPDIVGRRISLDGVQTTVVGVMPERFYFPTPELEIFLPLVMDPEDPVYANNGWLVLAGRIRTGASEADVADNLRTITTALDERYDYPAAFDKTRDPHVTPVREYLLGEIRPALLVLLAAVGVLLLMACANVSALILTKTADRTREMSVRAALGAGRVRLARQVVTESLLLGTLAALVGVLLAVGLFDVFKASLPVQAAFIDTVRLDASALVVSLALAVVVGVVVGLAPIRSILRGELTASAFALRADGASGIARARAQNALVVAEVLMAVVLVAGATLLTRTVGELRSIDLGLDPEGVMTIEVLLSATEASAEERTLFLQTLTQRAGALAGVRAAGLMNRLPLRDGGYQGPVRVDGRPDLDGANRPNVMFRPVTPGTLEALGAVLLEGRGILESDRAESPHVAVISESFARRIWGAESALGRTYSTGFVGHTGSVQVVGVVRDLAVQSMTGEQPMAAYYPWSQAMAGSAGGILVAKASGSATSLAEPLRALALEIEPRAAVGRVESLEQALDAEMAEPLRLRFFLGLFSALGVAMGVVGVYGVVAHSVQRRRAELGVRTALGAEPRRLLGEAVGRGMVPVAIGVLAGAAVSLLVTRVLARFLFGVEPTDPVSLLVAVGSLLAAGLGAAIVPAVRASATDPSLALRSD
jgi:predicted permease